MSVCLESIRALLEGVSDWVQVVDGEGYLIYTNQIWREAMGYCASAVIGLPLTTLLHPESRDRWQQVFQEVYQQQFRNRVPLNLTLLARDGTTHLLEGWIEFCDNLAESGQDVPPRSGVWGVWRQVIVTPEAIAVNCPANVPTEPQRQQRTRRTRAEKVAAIASTALWIGQSQILKDMAQGVPLPEILKAIARWVETQADGLICSFFRADAQLGTLKMLVAPSLPETSLQTLQNLAISPTGSCCGSAPVYRAPVVVQDITTNPLWEAHRPVALADGLQASWSTPIFSVKHVSAQPELWGTLTVYCRKPRKPRPFEQKLLETANRLASLAVSLQPAQPNGAIAPIKSNEERYRSIMAALNEGIVVQSAEGVVLECNPTAERILGISCDPRTQRTLVDPYCRYIRDDGSLFSEHEHPVNLALREGRSCNNVTLGVLKPSGVLTWISINCQPLFQENRTLPSAVVCSFTDITEQKQAQADLQSSEARYRAIVEDQTELVCRFLPDGTLTFVNDAYCTMLGIPREELLGYSYRMFLLALNQVGETELTTVVSPENPVSLLETQMILPNGDIRWHQWNNRALFTEQGTLVEFQAVGRDITERKRMEETLRQTTDRLNGILRSLDDVVWSTAVDGSKVFYVSPACEKVFGYTEQELCDRPSLWLEMIHPDDRPRVKSLLPDLLTTGMLLVEYRLIHPDEGVRWVYCRSWLVRDEQGKPLRVDRITSDITERKQAEVAVRESQELLELFFSQSLDGFFFMMLEQPIVWNDQTDKEAVLDYVFEHQHVTKANQAMLNQYAVAESAFLGATPRQFYAHDLEQGRALWWQMFDRGRLHIETDERKWDGTQMWVEGDYICLYNFKGEILGHFGIQREISDRKQAEADLRDSEARFRQIAETIDEVFFIVSSNFAQVLYISPAYEKIWGHSCQSLYQHPESWLETIVLEDKPIVRGALNLASQGSPIQSEFRITQRDGSLRWIFLRTFPICDEQGTLLRHVGLAEDISDRKQAEADLLRQNQRSQLFAEITLKIRQSLDLSEILQTTVMEVQQLLQADRVLLYCIRSDGSGTVVTEALDAGWQSLLGASLLPEINLEESQRWAKQRHLRAIADVQNEGISPQTANLLQRLEVQAELVVPILQRDELWGFLIVHQCDRPRLWSSFEIELLQQLGDQVGIALDQSQLVESLRDSEVEILKALEKERELSELKSRFVSMVSHEFRTPLTTIQSSAELLEYYDWTEDERKERFQQIRTSVQHMTQLLEDVLLIGKVDSGRMQFSPKPINVKEFCQELLADLQLTTSHLHRVLFRCSGNPQIAFLDPKLLRQILSNLLSNAVKYSPEGGDILLLLEYQPSQVKFSVHDQGIGIPQEDQEHLFEAFYRATNVDTIQGTGLGLAIVKKCVDLHKGGIKCESSVGSGTVFVVTLPVGQCAEETWYG